MLTGELIKLSIQCDSMRGVQVPKKKASEYMKLLKKFIDKEYKIYEHNEYVRIPIINADDVTAILGKYNLIIENFPFDKRDKKITSLKKELKARLPQHLHPFIPTAYDQIGDIAVIDMSRELLEYRYLIGDIFLKVHRSTRTVYRKSSKVSGITRIRQLELIAGNDNPITIHKEHGLRFYVNVKNVYFSPRLGTEHERIALQVKDNENILDMFSGIAPFGFHITKLRKCHYTAVDINPEVLESIKESLKLNKKIRGTIDVVIGDISEIYKNWVENKVKFDRILMNHPSAAFNYLDIAIKLLKKGGTIYLYTFAPLDYKNYIYDRIHDLLPALNINNIHRVRQSSPSEFHICIELTLD